LDQEQQTRERSFIRELLPDWRPTRQQRLWAVRIVIAVVVLLGILTLIGLPFGITLWLWLKLLIVPAVITGGGIWFNRQQRLRELEIAEQRTQDEVLQTYLDKMAQLMLDEAMPLRTSGEDDEVRTLARARTLTVLRRSDPARKRSVLDFLYEADLIKKTDPVIYLGSTDFFSSVADLRGADVGGADLKGADLGVQPLGKNGANLSRADLRGADLKGANLHLASLRDADLSAAELFRAALAEADLRYTHLVGTDFTEAKLGNANLSGASFRRPEGSTQQYAAQLKAAGFPDERIEQAIRGRTNLTGADLRGVNLSEADLTGAIVSNEQLDQAQSLKGTTMPNGQKYEDWLKTPEGQDWLRGYKKLLGDYKKALREYDTWIQTPEGQMWLKAVGEEEENGAPS